jgi:Na+-transporting NADH:ubiquinone oxidoreductase subunit NqrA
MQEGTVIVSFSISHFSSQSHASISKLKNGNKRENWMFVEPHFGQQSILLIFITSFLLRRLFKNGKLLKNFSELDSILFPI